MVTATASIWCSKDRSPREIMFRIVLCCGLATLLASCNGLRTTNNIDWEHARLACADVGLAPGSSAFDRCVSNLYNTLLEEENTAER
jgi:hypothetical protein